MKDESSDFFKHIPERNYWATVFREQLTFVCSSANIDRANMTFEQMQADKPVYLAVMAHRKQLQPILDNPHLFDPAFVNAVRVLVMQYDDLQILNE